MPENQNEKIDVAQKIIDLRDALGLTNYALAKKLGFERSTIIDNYTLGRKQADGSYKKSQPSLSMLGLMVKRLGLNPMYFLEKDAQPFIPTTSVVDTPKKEGAGKLETMEQRIQLLRESNQNLQIMLDQLLDTLQQYIPDKKVASALERLKKVRLYGSED